MHRYMHACIHIYIHTLMDCMQLHCLRCSPKPRLRLAFTEEVGPAHSPGGAFLGPSWGFAPPCDLRPSSLLRLPGALGWRWVLLGALLGQGAGAGAPSRQAVTLATLGAVALVQLGMCGEL